jgi:hypothetical protein
MKKALSSSFRNFDLQSDGMTRVRPNTPFTIRAMSNSKDSKVLQFAPLNLGGRVSDFYIMEKGVKVKHSFLFPETLQAYICDHLLQHDLNRIKCTSKGGQHFILKKHRIISIFRDPKHLDRLRNYDDLTLTQKLQLEFIKFNDRSFIQRIGIIIVCTIMSPFILIWHSPKFFRWFKRVVVDPACNFFYADVMVPITEKAIVPTSRFLTRYFFKPIFVVLPKQIASGIRYVYIHLFCPVSKQIASAIRSVYIHFICPASKQVHQGFILPCFRVLKLCLNAIRHHFGGTIKSICKFVSNKILLPSILFVLDHIILRTLGLVYHGFRCTFKYVVFPLCRGIGWGLQRFVFPAVRVGYIVMKGICVDFGVKIFKQFLLPPAKLVFYGAMVPAFNLISLVVSHSARLIAVSADALYTSILVPAGIVISATSSFVGSLFNK